MPKVVRRKCVFPLCQSRGQTGFYSFPSDPGKKALWLKACKLSLKDVKSSDRICINHFKSTDFDNHENANVQRKRLKSCAIPKAYSTEELFEDNNTFSLAEETVGDDSERGHDLLANCQLLTPQSEHDYSAPGHQCVCKECPNLKAQIKKLRCDIIYWREKSRKFEKKYEHTKQLQNSDTPAAKNFRNKITKERLSLNGSFSDIQIDLMLRKNKNNPKPFSQKWPQSDLLKAKKLYSIRGKALDFVRHIAGLPLPSKTTCSRKLGFLRVQRGFITPALIYLESSLLPRIPAREKLANIKFDEMKLMKTALYDQIGDSILGPNDYVQQVIVRSIFGKWMVPVYLDYDIAITVRHYNETIFHLEAIGVEVQLSACDQGPRNQGLATELGVTIDNVVIPNPFAANRYVVFTFDWVHAFKNLRNHFLDNFFKLLSDPNVIFAKEDFEELFDIVECTKLRFLNLKPIHLNCQQSDRQTVKYAVELLSGTVAALMKDCFPNSEKKHKLSDLISLLDQCWKIMTSKMVNVGSSDITKRPLSENLAQQLASLNELITVCEDMRFQVRKSKKDSPSWSKKPCQKAAIIAIKSAIKLQEILSEKYNEPSYGTENNTSDDLERTFGKIRDLYGSNDNPSALHYNQRVEYLITETILDDKGCDVFSLEDKINNCTKYNYDYATLNEHEPDHEPDTSDFESDEVFWVARTIAFRYKNDMLHDVTEEESRVNPKSLVLTKSLKQGNILPPSKQWLDDVTKMYKLFSEHHPLPWLLQGPGLCEKFTAKLQSVFPKRKLAHLKEFTTIRTNLQIKVINLITKERKKTARGARKLVETINC